MVKVKIEINMIDKRDIVVKQQDANPNEIGRADYSRPYEIGCQRHKAGMSEIDEKQAGKHSGRQSMRASASEGRHLSRRCRCES